MRSLVGPPHVAPAADVGGAAGRRKRPLHSMGPIDEDGDGPFLDEQDEGPEPSTQRVRHDADDGD